MPKTVAYLIISTESDQERQLREIQLAGFDLHRAFTARSSETRHPPLKRGAFALMLSSRLQPFDRLVVTRLNCLGRTAVEVLNTVDLLRGRDVLVHCVELERCGRAELTRSAPGQIIMQTIAATVKLEAAERERRRDARKPSKILGRPPALTENQRREALDRLATCGNVSAVARAMKTSRATVIRARNGASSC